MVMAQAINHSTLVAEAGRSAWSTEQISGHQGLHREILPQKNKKIAFYKLLFLFYVCMYMYAKYI